MNNRLTKAHVHYEADINKYSTNHYEGHTKILKSTEINM